MKSRGRVILTIIEELAMVAVLLLAFAFFHHVLPSMRAKTVTVSVPPVVTPAPAPLNTPAASEPECSTEMISRSLQRSRTPILRNGRRNFPSISPRKW